MEFMSAYKRLDNICKDMLESNRGVSTYIEEMEHAREKHYKPITWNDDYQDLKYYRHLRNRIVHENNVDEYDVCSDEDIVWIEDFINRILQRTDSLSVYKRNRTKELNCNCAINKSRVEIDSEIYYPDTKRSVVGSVICILVFVVCVILLLAYIFEI